MFVLIKRKLEGPSVPELGQPTSATFDSVTVPLNRASTGPAALGSYELQRSLDGTTWTTIATGPGIFGNPPRQYVDGGRTALTTYYYRARATDVAGRVSDFCAAVSVRTASQAGTEDTGDRWGMGFIGGVPEHSGSGKNPFATQYSDPKYIAQMAKRQHVVIGGWQEIESQGRRPLEEIVRAVKAASQVGTKIYQYYLPEALEETWPVPYRNSLRNKLNAESWWLYESGTSGNKVPSFWAVYQPEMRTINTSAHVRPDANGLIASEWIVKDTIDWAMDGQLNNTPAPSLDGLYQDNTNPLPGVVGDWDLDGQAEDWTYKYDDQPPAPQAETAQYREGWARAARYFRQRKPDKLLLCNATGQYITRKMAGYGYPVPQMDQEYHGGIYEFLTNLTDGSQTAMRLCEQYRDIEDSFRPPRILIYQHHALVPGTFNDHRSAMYGFAHCRVAGNGYYNYTVYSGHSTHEWFDWMDFKLGRPLEPRITAPTHGECWMRNFENGIVIWWPRGVTQTVNLGGTFYVLRGDGARWLTPGAAVTSVTPPTGQDRNGLLLSRTPT